MKKIFSALITLLLLLTAPVMVKGQSSPCGANAIHPFTTGSNPFGITYTSSTTGTATFFVDGGASPGCLGSTPGPNWYYFQKRTQGDILIYIQQPQGDVDYACWGPFKTPNDEPGEFLSTLCSNGYNTNSNNCYYHLFTGDGSQSSLGSGPGSHRPSGGNHTNNLGGWPYPDATGHPDWAYGNTGHNIPMVDCSYYADATEWCYVPADCGNPGDFFLLLICNYSRQPGSYTFTQSGGTAATSGDIFVQVRGAEEALCEGQTLILTYHEWLPYHNPNYQWILPDGSTLPGTRDASDNVVLEIPNITPAHGGRYRLRKTFASVATPEDVFSDSLVVRPAPLPSFSVAPGTTFCEGDTLALIVTSAFPNTFFDTLSSDPDWSYIIPGTPTNRFVFPAVAMTSDSISYRLFASTSSMYGMGCEVDTVVTFYCARTSSGEIPDTICVGDSYNRYDFTLPVQTRARDTLLVRSGLINSADCDSTSVVHLYVMPNPKIETLAKGPEHCGGAAGDGFLHIVVTEAARPFVCAWNPSVTLTVDSVSGDTTFMFLDNIHGQTYSLTVTDTVGCESSFTVEVPVLPNPVACFSLIPEAPSYLVGENIVFSNCSQYYNLCHWDFGDISESTVPSPSHTYAEIGTYDITLHVSDTTAGCDDTFEKTIIVHEKTRFYLPNSFTPNGDNVNDIFIPVQMEVKEDSYTMLIYDRYGMLVFKSTDLNRGWDGTVNGRLVPTGDTYVYRISYQDFDGNVFEKNGKVTVVY